MENKKIMLVKDCTISFSKDDILITLNTDYIMRDILLTRPYIKTEEYIFTFKSHIKIPSDKILISKTVYLEINDIEQNKKSSLEGVFVTD